MTASAQTTVTQRRIDVGRTVPALAGRVTAASVFTPSEPVVPIVFCCLSGGGSSRRYWDLPVPEDDSYSFARWMARQGCAVLTVDHAGTGESALAGAGDVPLLGDVIAANDAVFGLLCDELRETLFVDAQPRRVGVGHSMGGCLTVRQQAIHETYDALCVMGFDTRGLPDVLTPEVRELLATGPADDQLLAELTRRMFGSPYPALRADINGEAGERIPAPVRQAMSESATRLLGAGGMLSLLPGNVAEDTAQIRVPVLVLNGEYDTLINGTIDTAAQYPLASSFTSQVLPGAGHNHNIAPTRKLFWENILRWAEQKFGPH